ncbi:hypothetical protein J2794_003835 [Paraburkholderia terricola]|uniref:hypothetical protein n=1 Tax=Paraburkholderia terricola TaxID=169427 RepID=UPI00285BC19E|nr:hypothetical protein [Paraburkholderia terricola]MDR6447719.1 hypothetical protein [Paraburkholderia terricola]
MTLSSLREAAAVTIHTKATLYPIMPECVFHTKLDKDFAASWTGFSHEAGHGFHGKLDSDFAPGWTVRS